MSDIWTFKGKRLRTGDYVSFHTRQRSEVGAAVICVPETCGFLEVLSAQFLTSNHIGIFCAEEIENLQVLLQAKDAIPRGSKRNFYPYQRVSLLRNGVTHKGKVIAACNSLVVARQEDGQLLHGDAKDYTPILGELVTRSIEY